MNRKNKLLQWIKISSFVLGLGLSVSSFAEPVIVDGAVPNEMTKQAILAKMRSVYGDDQVIDKIQVRPVSAPNGWSDSVTKLITPDLKKVRQGQLKVRGTQVDLTGKVLTQEDIQPTSNLFQALVQQPYRFASQLSINHAEQAIIDNALRNRIIEFESGSAVLLPAGIQILDEMVIALNKVQGKNVKIIGHTDSQGNPDKNKTLSQQRADAVKQYLIAKNIAATRLSTEGFGADKPVADNATPEGRKKNRRIEFEVQ
ncbi:OmpA family protein [Acinetobacter shaoyimingii]|uniref:OmpA family protein n=1 Tax=Acinetobacter shaoyimingii TaxID=2715164 RepID=A0A6G8RZQ6_9GAMM|nr:OmpA family protein [Acinetobacter shaoyimingii]QIO07344.1 OmpA family protein [Acinetobacter shaoyimingii]